MNQLANIASRRLAASWLLWCLSSRNTSFLSRILSAVLLRDLLQVHPDYMTYCKSTLIVWPTASLPWLYDLLQVHPERVVFHLKHFFSKNETDLTVFLVVVFWGDSELEVEGRGSVGAVLSPYLSLKRGSSILKLNRQSVCTFISSYSRSSCNKWDQT